VGCEREEKGAACVDSKYRIRNGIAEKHYS